MWGPGEPTVWWAGKGDIVLRAEPTFVVRMRT